MHPGSRHVRLFKNGRNQAVRIPRDMELPGDKAVIYRDGQRLIIEPVTQRSLTRLISTWEPLDIEWLEVMDQAASPWTNHDHAFPARHERFVAAHSESARHRGHALSCTRSSNGPRWSRTMSPSSSACPGSTSRTGYVRDDAPDQLLNL